MNSVYYTLQPENYLQPNVTYYIHIKNKITDKAGNNIDFNGATEEVKEIMLTQ